MTACAATLFTGGKHQSNFNPTLALSALNPYFPYAPTGLTHSHEVHKFAKVYLSNKWKHSGSGVGAYCPIPIQFK